MLRRNVYVYSSSESSLSSEDEDEDDDVLCEEETQLDKKKRQPLKVKGQSKFYFVSRSVSVGLIAYLIINMKHFIF